MLQPRSLGPGVTVFDDVDVERDDMLDEIIGLKGDDLGISQLIGADRVGMGVWIKLVSRRCLGLGDDDVSERHRVEHD